MIAAFATFSAAYCCLLQLMQMFTSAHFQLMQSLTEVYALTNAIASEPHSSFSASLHVLGLNTYIVRPFGHPS